MKNKDHFYYHPEHLSDKFLKSGNEQHPYIICFNGRKPENGKEILITFGDNIGNNILFEKRNLIFWYKVIKYLPFCIFRHIKWIKYCIEYSRKK